MTTQYLTGYFEVVPLTLELGSKIDVNELIKCWESEIEIALRIEDREEYMESQWYELYIVQKEWYDRDTIEQYTTLPLRWCKSIAILLKLGVTNDDEVEIRLKVKVDESESW